MNDYNEADLNTAIQQLFDRANVDGDTVYCHSNLGYFGRMMEVETPTQICEKFYTAIYRTIGDNGTLIAPTYSYANMKGDVFDAKNPAHQMGIFSTWMQQRQDSYFSDDPGFSIVSNGRHAAHLCNDTSRHSFDKNSHFARFLDLKGSILCLNHPGCTFIHHVEYCLKVKYRYTKKFTAKILTDNGIKTIDTYSFVWHYSDENSRHWPWAFDRLAREQGLLHSVKLGRGEATLIKAQDVFTLIEQTIGTRPYFLTLAEKNGLSTLNLSPYESKMA
jgi:aminoglycoside 3-N-acetyltransferase